MEHLIFWPVSIFIIFFISKLRKVDFSNRSLEIAYTILALHIGACYYIIFRYNGEVTFLWQHIYTIKSDLIKLISILISLYVILFSLFRGKQKYKDNLYHSITDTIQINQQVIKTRIRPKDLIIQAIISVPAFIIFIFILYIIFLLSHNILSFHDFFQDKIRYIYTYFLFCVFYAYLYINYHKKREIWLLEEHQLSCGKPVIFSIQLDDIDSIMIGRPVKKLSDYHFFKLFLKPDEKIKTSATYLDGSIILKMKKNSYINLNIRHLCGGTEIIQKILRILENKVDDNYQFSMKERQLFGPRKRNRMLHL